MFRGLPESVGDLLGMLFTQPSSGALPGCSPRLAWGSFPCCHPRCQLQAARSVWPRQESGTQAQVRWCPHPCHLGPFREQRRHPTALLRPEGRVCSRCRSIQGDCGHPQAGEDLVFPVPSSSHAEPQTVHVGTAPGALGSGGGTVLPASEAVVPRLLAVTRGSRLPRRCRADPRPEGPGRGSAHTVCVWGGGPDHGSSGVTGAAGHPPRSELTPVVLSLLPRPRHCLLRVWASGLRPLRVSGSAVHAGSPAPVSCAAMCGP